MNPFVPLMHLLFQAFWYVDIDLRMSSGVSFIAVLYKVYLINKVAMIYRNDW